MILPAHAQDRIHIFFSPFLLVPSCSLPFSFFFSFLAWCHEMSSFSHIMFFPHEISDLKPSVREKGLEAEPLKRSANMSSALLQLFVSELLPQEWSISTVQSWLLALAREILYAVQDMKQQRTSFQILILLSALQYAVASCEKSKILLAYLELKQQLCPEMRLYAVRLESRQSKAGGNTFHCFQILYKTIANSKVNVFSQEVTCSLLRLCTSIQSSSLSCSSPLSSYICKYICIISSIQEASVISCVQVCTHYKVGI